MEDGEKHSLNESYRKAMDLQPKPFVDVLQSISAFRLEAEARGPPVVATKLLEQQEVKLMRNSSSVFDEDEDEEEYESEHELTEATESQKQPLHKQQDEEEATPGNRKREGSVERATETVKQTAETVKKVREASSSPPRELPRSDSISKIKVPAVFRTDSLRQQLPSAGSSSLSIEDDGSSSVTTSPGKLVIPAVFMSYKPPASTPTRPAFRKPKPSTPINSPPRLKSATKNCSDTSVAGATPLDDSATVCLTDSACSTPNSGLATAEEGLYTPRSLLNVSSDSALNSSTDATSDQRDEEADNANTLDLSPIHPKNLTLQGGSGIEECKSDLLSSTPPVEPAQPPSATIDEEPQTPTVTTAKSHDTEDSSIVGSHGACDVILDHLTDEEALKGFELSDIDDPIDPPTLSAESMTVDACHSKIPSPAEPSTPLRKIQEEEEAHPATKTKESALHLLNDSRSATEIAVAALREAENNCLIDPVLNTAGSLSIEEEIRKKMLEQHQLLLGEEDDESLLGDKYFTPDTPKARRKEGMPPLPTPPGHHRKKSSSSPRTARQKIKRPVFRAASLVDAGLSEEAEEGLAVTAYPEKRDNRSNSVAKTASMKKDGGHFHRTTVNDEEQDQIHRLGGILDGLMAQSPSQRPSAIRETVKASIESQSQHPLVKEALTLPPEQNQSQEKFNDDIDANPSCEPCKVQ